MSIRPRTFRLLGVALSTSLLVGFAVSDACGQSAWTKMKQQFLQQACKGGDQNACQQLARLNQKQSQSQAQPQPAGQQQVQEQPAPDVVVGNRAAASVRSADAEAGASQPEQAWAPPAEAAQPKPAGPLDPMKLPDIQGIHPGMTVEQANQVIAKLAPGARIPWYNSAMVLPTTNIVAGHAASQLTLAYDWVQLGGGAKDTNLELSLEATRPPNQEHIWHIGLRTQRQHINRAVLFAALRRKYGKELLATDFHDQPVNDDNRISNLWWVYDEQGHPRSPAPSVVNGSPNGCGDPGYGLSSKARYGSGGGDSTTAGKDADPGCMWVGVRAMFPSGAGEIIEYYFLSLWDAPLSVRESKVTDAWLQAQLEKARRESLERSKEAKPTL